MDKQVEDAIDQGTMIVNKWNEHALGMPSNSRQKLFTCWMVLVARIRFLEKKEESRGL